MNDYYLPDQTYANPPAAGLYDYTDETCSGYAVMDDYGTLVRPTVNIWDRRWYSLNT